MSNRSRSSMTDVNASGNTDSDIRHSKKITSDVAEWTEYMRNKTGAQIFVICAYTDEDGGLAFGR